MIKFLKVFFLISTITLYLVVNGQYAPAVGQAGTTAIFKDSNIIVGWAASATISRGFQSLADSNLGLTITGDEFSAVGAPDNNVVSLGDGGIAEVHFVNPIKDGPGWDFAVFENSFDGDYLELAFVEVSSDGISFHRFPAHSLTQTNNQVGGFGTLNPVQINNLAGKYKANYGTPFNLSELSGIPGLDLQNIVAIRLVDVVGSLNPLFSTYDTSTNVINDPWPTPFASGGFDLDAIAVINQSLAIITQMAKTKVEFFPNPAINFIKTTNTGNLQYKIFGIEGKLLHEGVISSDEIRLDQLSPGIYIIEIMGFERIKIVKVED